MAGDRRKKKPGRTQESPRIQKSARLEEQKHSPMTGQKRSRVSEIPEAQRSIEPSQKGSHIHISKNPRCSICWRESQDFYRFGEKSGSILPQTESDEVLREQKSTPYEDDQFPLLLETQASSNLYDHQDGIASTSEALCKELLEAEQTVPTDSLFDENAAMTTFRKLQGRNEAKVIKDITPLIAPSVESFTTRGAKHLDHMVESVYQGWSNSVPIINPRPQPDYAVGFARSAFSDDQILRLKPMLGNPSCSSYFLGTFYMLFPFFACEVKTGSVGLVIADRQNANSMTIAVRAVVELAKLVNRQHTVHREIQAFSISHDDSGVKIYGHYPVIDGEKTSYWRHLIRAFDFQDQNGKERWTAYKFTKSVYDLWVPRHWKKISSFIDVIPENLDLSAPRPHGEPNVPPAALSPAKGESDQHDQTSQVEAQPITQDTSMQANAPASKKKRKHA